MLISMFDSVRQVELEHEVRKFRAKTIERLAPDGETAMMLAVNLAQVGQTYTSACGFCCVALEACRRNDCENAKAWYEMAKLAFRVVMMYRGRNRNTFKRVMEAETLDALRGIHLN